MYNNSNYSAFTDCDSETVVIRLPYSFCVSLVQHVPDTEERKILITKLSRCRSKKLKEFMRNARLI